MNADDANNFLDNLHILILIFTTPNILPMFGADCTNNKTILSLKQNVTISPCHTNLQVKIHGY